MKVYVLYTDVTESAAHHGIYATRKAARRALKEYREKYPYTKEYPEDFRILEEKVIEE